METSFELFGRTLCLLLNLAAFPLPDWLPHYDVVRGAILANGDVVSVEIDNTANLSGWTALVTLEGLGAEAANVQQSDFDFGDIEGGSPNFVFTVVSEGYDSSGTLGTITRTVYGTKVVRKPHPDDADLDATNDAGDLVLRVSLSEYIYNDDKDGGAGTSGTNPTVTIAANWFDDGTNTSNATTDLTVTNNSDVDYPKVLGGWSYIETPLDRRVEADFVQAFHAVHGFGVSCVTFDATGNTSSLTSQQTVTTQQAIQASKSGLYQSVYKRTVPLGAFTQGENITQRARAYPKVGDADSVLDTEDNTALATLINGHGRILATCDSTGALKSYATVTTTGDDGTGVVSSTLATADASPFATIGQALEDGATVIYVRTGTHDILGSVPSSTTDRDYAVEVRPHPSDTASGITLNRGGSFRTYKQNKLAYIGFPNITYTSGNGWIDGQDRSRFVQFIDCDMTATSRPTAGLGYRSAGCWFINCTLGNSDDLDTISGGAFYHIEGCDIGSLPDFNAARQVIATTGEGATNSEHLIQTGSSGSTLDNVHYCFNAFLDLTSSSAKLLECDTETSAAVYGNLIEFSTTTATQPTFYLYADGSTTPCNNWVVAHNTLVGNRCNLFYNDDGTAAVSRSNIFLRGNSFQAFNTKADVFPTASGNRIGNWAFVYGVGVSDNRYDGTEGSNFTGEYSGFNTLYLDGQDTTYGTIEYVDDQGVDGGAGGNGDYTPATGGNLDGTLSLDPLVLFDLYGTRFVTDGTGAAGAVQRDLFVTPTGTSRRLNSSKYQFFYRK